MVFILIQIIPVNINLKHKRTLGIHIYLNIPITQQKYLNIEK